MKVLRYIIFSILFAVYPLQSDSFSADRETGNFFTNLHSPILHYILKYDTYNVPLTLAESNGDRLEATVPYWQNNRINKTCDKLADEKSKYFLLRNNFFIRLLTLGNRASLANLNSASILGEDFIPYFIFGYRNEDSYYLPAALDAPSVLLYLYSWLINLPAKYTDILDDAKTARIAFSEKAEKLNFSDRCLLTLDFLISLFICLVIEIPLAMANTVAGFFVALIMNPVESLCSVPGFFYFGIITTFNAIWDFIVNLIVFPIHQLGFYQ